jgi:hypothetical protein
LLGFADATAAKLSLQMRCQFGSLKNVRVLFGLFLVVFLISPASGQEQERKLVDRLLRPDMSLHSTEQNKKFVADRTPVDKHAPVSAFYLQQKPSERKFAGTRDVSTQSFNDQRAARTKSADLPSRTETPNSAYPTSQKPVKAANDASKQKKTTDYAGNRPFLAEGKSQKSLSRKNPPMTIEQVRELLNKNK